MAFVKKNNYKKRYDIFISYRRRGGESLPYLLFDSLQEYGYSAFFDREEMRSGQFDEQIFAVIEQAGCKDFIIILTNEYFKSVSEPDYVKEELRCALAHEKRIIAIEVSDFKMPDVLPLGFEGLQNVKPIHLSESFFKQSVRRMLKKELTGKSWIKRQLLLSQTRYFYHIYCYILIILSLIGIFSSSKFYMSYNKEKEQQRLRNEISILADKGSWKDIIGYESRIDMPDAQTLLNFAEAHNQKGDPYGFYSYSKICLEEYPQEADAYMKLAYYYYEKGEKDKVLAMLNAYLLVCPSSNLDGRIYALEYLMNYNLEYGNTLEPAFKYASQILDLKNNHYKALETINLFYLQKKDIDSLRKYSSYMKDFFPDSTNTLKMQIFCNLVNKDTVSILKVMTKIVASGNYDENDLYNLISFYLYVDGIDAAESYMSKFSGFPGADKRIPYLLAKARIEFKKGYKAESGSWIKRALEIDPKSSIIKKAIEELK